MSTKIPVIIDTDMGTDIDDTWALIMALNSPEIEIKLIVSATGDTVLRAKLIARLLTVLGRSDIPIGIGIPLESSHHYQAKWVEGYELNQYPGPILQDGVGAIVNGIMQSPMPVTVLGLAPLPNIAAALARQPEITKNARFVGMHGSIRRGYLGSADIAAEFNVLQFPYACREVFAAAWPVTITPLDTCGLVQLKGEKYQAVRACTSPAIQALMENYQIWTRYNRNPLYHGFIPALESSILYDAVAVYLAFSEEFLQMEQLGIQVSGDGYLTLDEQVKPIRCAMNWLDLPAFEDLLVSRLIRS